MRSQGRIRLAMTVTAAVLAVGSTAMGATRVVVLPFAGASPQPTRDAWISTAVQQNVIMTLGQSRGLQPLASGVVPKVVDAAIAARTAKAGGADMGVFGTYEIVGDQVRFTAQLVDAGTGQS